MSFQFYVILFLFFCYLTYCARLNVPRILLPYNLGVPTNYTLEVKGGGCYNWYSNKPEVAFLRPVFTNDKETICSNKALVSALSRVPTRDTAIIQAKDENTGEIFRCDVIVDVIQSIEIVTTTRVLFLEDAPEIFEIQAKNDQEDTFSSLEGVTFDWRLTSESLAKTTNYGVLRFLKFSESSYATPPAIDFWEKQGLRGSMILMEGSKAGFSKVTVKPRDKEYKHVKPFEVGLVVVANLILLPAHAYLIPGSIAQFQVNLIKQGKAHAISLPSDDYYLEVKDNLIALLDVQTSEITALKLGQTAVVVKDHSVTSNEASYLPSANIYVTNPKYIALTVLPGQKWSLQEKKFYTIIVDIFDENNQLIHPSSNLHVTVVFPYEYFHVDFSTSNGTYHNVETLQPGSCKIRAELHGIKNKDGSVFRINPISTSQDVIIYETLTVTPSFTFLPWDPIMKPTYTLQLKANGGTGMYHWFSNNKSVAILDYQREELGQKCKVTVYEMGHVHVKATDKNVPLFVGIAKISVQPVVGLEILPKVVEAEVGQDIHLPLAIYGYEDEKKLRKRVFDDCSQIPLIVDVVDKTKFLIKKDNILVESANKGIYCRLLSFTCSDVGHSLIVIRYESGDLSLKAEAVIACHRPLKILYPKEEVVLAVGTSIDVLFEGGPRPWPLYKAGHFMHVTLSKTSLVQVTKALLQSVASKDTHTFQVICRELGETSVELAIGNQVSLHNQFPIKSSSSARIICGIPDSLSLIPVILEPKNIELPCPVPKENVPISNYRDLQIELIIKDKKGRQFFNASSLDIKWELSNYTLASLQNQVDIRRTDKGSSSLSQDQIFQVLHPKGIDGSLIVSGIIVGYIADILKANRITSVDFFPEVIDTLELKLVDDAEVLPGNKSIFNSPSNKASLSITKGSGHYHVVLSDKTKAHVQFIKRTNQIEIIPIDVGSFSITVYDLCLEMQSPTTSFITIYGISTILVDMVNKVELGKTIIASVQVLDDNKQRIHASLFPLMELHPVLSSEIISVRLQGEFEANHYNAFYTVEGLTLGHTILNFVAIPNKGSELLYSESLPVQVFPPLSLNPQNITLLAGGKFQVSCTGGPQPQASIEYSVNDRSVATVTTAGIITAKKLGKTVITAKSVGKDKNGSYVVFSQDEATIFVILMNGIRIQAPLTRMQTGTEMPVFAAGLRENETPFTIGQAFPRLHFKWSINNEKVASIETVYQHVGIQEVEENNFAIRIKAKEGGSIVLRLQVHVSDYPTDRYTKNINFTDEIQIQIFEKLKLLQPPIEGGTVLMSPFSQMKLDCNRFGIAKVSYQVIDTSTSLAVASVDENGLLTSSSLCGESILIVRAEEEFDIVQSLTLYVRVKEISYLMLRPNTVIRTGEWPLTAIPFGFTMKFEVTYHDNIGVVFHATNAQLMFRPSRFDSIRVSLGSNNGTLMVQALNTGNTVLKVWDTSNVQMADYINVPVKMAIDPSNLQLVVGDVVCFSSTLVTEEGHHGSWFSNNDNIMLVHEISGAGVALQPGTVIVQYLLSSSIHTTTQAIISPATKIQILSTSTLHLTNVPGNKPFYIPVVISGEGITRKTNRIGKICNNTLGDTLLPFFKIPFTCQLAFVDSSLDIAVTDVFYTQPGFDLKKGQYHCQVVPVNRISESEISSITSPISVSVFMSSENEQHIGPMSQQSVILPFFPAFYVHTTEIILSNLQPIGVITVSAVATVQECLSVTPSNNALLEVLPPKSDSKYPNNILYQVKLYDIAAFWVNNQDPLQIELSCMLTKQQVIVTIKLKLLNQLGEPVQCTSMNYAAMGWKGLFKTLWDNYQSFMVTFVSVGGTITCLFIGYRALFNSRRISETSQRSVFLKHAHPSVDSSHSGFSGPPFSPEASHARSLASDYYLWSTNTPQRSPSRSRTSFSPSS